MIKTILLDIIMLFRIILLLPPLLLSGIIQIKPEPLHREYDPVIIKGKEFTALLENDISTICLFAYDGKAIKEIPSQIDEMEDGEYLWDMVRIGGKWKRSQNKKKGKLTQDDEVVFMARDSGVETTEGKALSGLNYRITLTDPESRAVGFVYAGRCRNQRENNVDYIRYKPDENIVESDEYVYGFTDKKHPAILNLFAVNTGDEPINLLDRYKLRAFFSLFFGKIRINKDEEDINSDVTAFIDGEIRIIQKIKYSLNILADIPSPYVTRIVKNYRNFAEFPNNLFIPFRPGIIVTEISLLTTLDFRKQVSGASIYTQHFMTPLHVDGMMSEEEYKLREKFPFWVVLYNETGGLVGRIFADELLLKQDIEKEFYYLDNSNVIDKKEYEQGAYGEMGWKIKRLENLKKGDYFFNIVIYGKKGFREGDEADFLKIADRPLNIYIQELR